MATVWWSPNGQIIAQVDTLTVTAVANGGTLTATINTKTITYTCTATDTTTTAATNWFNLLQSTGTVPPEFNEIQWSNPSSGVIKATGGTPGTPFILTTSGGGGATVTQVHTTANSSNSDVNNANNWLRGGTAGLPQNGDTVIINNSSVSLLWSLDQLAAIQFASLTIWQNFTGTIGLSENNPLGYIEYRPTYFQFAGPTGGVVLPITIGAGLGQNIGSGSGRIRLNVGSQKTSLTVQATGSALDAYALRFLGTNAANTATITGSSVAVAMLAGEAATLASATVDGGGSIGLGAGCTFSGTLALDAASANLFCAPATVTVQNGSSVNVQGVSLTYATITARNNSTLTWLSNSTITTLTMAAGCTLDVSGSTQPFTITNSTVDVDTCFVLDPNNSITWTNATTANNQCYSGPFQFGPGRTVKIT
jgi:hypothetical protein